MPYTLALAAAETNSLNRVAMDLAAMPRVQARRNVALSGVARFGIGGRARLFVESSDPEAFVKALERVREADLPWMVLGGGTNLIVNDAGYDGVILRFRGSRLNVRGQSIWVESGAMLEDLVDASVEAGLEGLHTMKRIPGWVGGAIYGNAGAYGHSINEFVEHVTYIEDGKPQTLSGAECEFAYRHSVFKLYKESIIIATELRLPKGNAGTLRARANEIQRIRDEKFPPTMRCAGSIFKNFLAVDLPQDALARVPAKSIIEGKVPAAWFLEQVGAKGMRQGDIQVASYHANLIYNDGTGTAADFRNLASELKRRVKEQFGVTCEEEVQYVGW